MGYSTDYTGSIKIDPPLSEAERDCINLFGSTRRMDRKRGPYHCGGGFAGQDNESDIIDYNKPPAGQPGLWCKWEASEDGSELGWNGAEKFYMAQEWMAYLRSHFIVLGAAKYLEAESFGFLQPHAMSGLIHAVGENMSSDLWRMKVDGEGVWISSGEWTEKAQIELFGKDPGAEEGEDDAEGWGSESTMSDCAARASEEGLAQWSQWERVEDYEDPQVGHRVQALREREAVDGSALPAKSISAVKKL